MVTDHSNSQEGERLSILRRTSSCCLKRSSSSSHCCFARRLLSSSMCRTLSRSSSALSSTCCLARRPRSSASKRFSCFCFSCCSCSQFATLKAVAQYRTQGASPQASVVTNSQRGAGLTHFSFLSKGLCFFSFTLPSYFSFLFIPLSLPFLPVLFFSYVIFLSFFFQPFLSCSVFIKSLSPHFSSKFSTLFFFSLHFVLSLVFLSLFFCFLSFLFVSFFQFIFICFTFCCFSFLYFS